MLRVFNTVEKYIPNPDSSPHSKNLDLLPSGLTFPAFVLAI